MNTIDPERGDPALDTLTRLAPAEPEPTVQSARTVLDPLTYFKLKSALLAIIVQEGQLREQAQSLQQQKTKLFADVGLTVANYQLTDETYSIELVSR